MVSLWSWKFFPFLCWSLQLITRPLSPIACVSCVLFFCQSIRHVEFEESLQLITILQRQGTKMVLALHDHSSGALLKEIGFFHMLNLVSLQLCRICLAHCSLPSAIFLLGSRQWRVDAHGDTALGVCVYVMPVCVQVYARVCAWFVCLYTCMFVHLHVRVPALRVYTCTCAAVADKIGKHHAVKAIVPWTLDL